MKALLVGVLFQLRLKVKVAFKWTEGKKEDISDEKGNVKEILRVKASEVCIFICEDTLWNASDSVVLRWFWKMS